MKKNLNFPRFFENRLYHTLKSLYAFFSLNLVGKNQQNSIRLFCGGKSFMTIPHFRFHSEILTINLTAFVKDFFYFSKEEQ